MLFDVVRLWMVCVLAAGLGFVNLIDNPTRQAFVGEMVGPQHLTNAVGLNAVLVNLARALGPAVAGILIVTVGHRALLLDQRRLLPGARSPLSP